MSIVPDFRLCTRISDLRVRENPEVPRVLGLYAAAVALSDAPAMTAALELGRERAVGRTAFYELTLQSYLFLGFPRMLIAVEHLAIVWPEPIQIVEPFPISANEARKWFERGESLCKTVYGDAYEPLKAKVMSMSPELFSWMIVEGYGKVLSRPGLGSIEREIGNVAFLMVDDCVSQLHSHMRGALRVGAAPELLAAVVHDVGGAAGKGYQSALSILARLGIN